MNCSRISLLAIVLSVHVAHGQDCDCMCPMQYYGNMGGAHWYYFLCCDCQGGEPTCMPSDFRTLPYALSDSQLGCNGNGCNDPNLCVQAPGDTSAASAQESSAPGEPIPDPVAPTVGPLSSAGLINRPVALPHRNKPGEPKGGYKGQDETNGTFTPQFGEVIFDVPVRLADTEVYFRLLCIQVGEGDDALYNFLAMECDRAHRGLAEQYYGGQIALVTFEDNPEIPASGDGNGDHRFTHRLNISDATSGLAGIEPENRKYAWAVSYHELGHEE